jgi:transcriptional regulator with XRE-family HTH domain
MKVTDTVGNKEMYSKELIEMYLKLKNYSQQKQMAQDINMSQSFLSDIYNGRREFTDETAIYIAIECGLDPQEVVMKLAAARARTPQAKSVWAQVLKTYCAGDRAASCAGLSAIAALSMAHFNFALCLLMVSDGKVRRFAQHA